MNNNLYKKFVGQSKNLLLSLSASSPHVPLMIPTTKRILLYHRFTQSPDPNCLKIDAHTFECQLRLLAKWWHVIPLGDLFESIYEQRLLPVKSVVITVDDGYLDFYEIAYPLLQKYGLPATFFPTLNFVEGRIWLWPDILSYIFDSCKKSHLRVSFKGSTFELRLGKPEERQRIWQNMSDFCSDLPDHQKWEFIYYLSAVAEVNVPDQPVQEYAPVNFDQLEEMSSNGIEIGTHTLNHPILSKVDGITLERELSEPKRILEERLGTEIRSLAYPSGREMDISTEVVDSARRCGYSGAVVTRRAYGKHYGADRFQLPRMGVGNDIADFCWKLYGMELFAEYLKNLLRN